MIVAKICLLLIGLPKVTMARNKSKVPTFPKDQVSWQSVLTTATDNFDAFSLSSEVGNVDFNRVLDKRWAEDHTEYGPIISRVLEHIRTNNNYDRRIRPRYKGPPVEVRITMFIASISHISEANMDVTIDFYFRQFWRDHRMDFTNIWQEEISIGGGFMREIWRPDTFFVNAKSSLFHHVTSLNTFLRILPTGNVTQSIRLTVTASCPMDLTYFPMDSQRCSLQIESFGYPSREILYHWANGEDPSVEFADEVKYLPQFRVRGHREYESMIFLSTGNYSRLLLDVYLERNLGYYIIQVYLPSVLIVMMSLISFWISRESAPARVSLGITTVLTMQTLISSTNASLPKISYLKAIDIYLVSCFITVFSALLEYAAVSYTGKRCEMVRRKQRKMNAETQVDVENVLKLLPLRTTISLDFDEIKNELMASKQQAVEEDMCKCCLKSTTKASDIEKYSRIIFPTFFGAFNIVYWTMYLNISKVNSHDESGFIAMGSM